MGHGVRRQSSHNTTVGGVDKLGVCVGHGDENAKRLCLVLGHHGMEMEKTRCRMMQHEIKQKQETREGLAQATEPINSLEHPRPSNNTTKQQQEIEFFEGKRRLHQRGKNGGHGRWTGCDDARETKLKSKVTRHFCFFHAS